ncbi:hypothetical protein [Nostoc sp. UIC 10630]|uniref:hypothetical protein n=1 Tax=Nostoc sp. UIC 10630 TaxID=2100146 RepID=UPI001A9CA87D|nr:hypothetical protein [Nostoc sp. UIC 10630]
MEPKVVISAIADITTVTQRNNGVPHSLQERDYPFLCEYKILIKVSRRMKP